MVQGDSSLDDPQGSSAFQQELKVHLLAIQRKLDELGRRIDARQGASPGGPCRKISVAQVAAEAQQRPDRRTSLLTVACAAPPLPHSTMDGDLEVIHLGHDAPAEANADSKDRGVGLSRAGSKEGTANELRSAQDPGGRIVVGGVAKAEGNAPAEMGPFFGLRAWSAQSRRRMTPESEHGFGGVLPAARGESAEALELKTQGTMGGSTDTMPSIPQLPQQQQQGRQRRGSQGSSIMSEDGLRLRSLLNWLRLERAPGRASVVMHRMGVTNMVGAARELVSVRSSAVQQRCIFRFVHGVHFQLLCSLMIGLNVITIGVSANARLKCELSKTPEPPVWEYIDVVFVVFFAAEVALRIFADRLLFLFGSEWKWNVFDSVLVLSSLLDLVLSKFASAALSDVTIARVLRFVRFVRIIRIARAVRAFHSLRIVVFAIIESVMQLIWCLLVVGLIIYMFALFFLLGLTEHVTSPEWDSNDQAAILVEYYGSVPTAIVSLFMTISGGVDWRDLMRPLESIHWIYQPVFTFYVFLMVIGVLNVVMGAFVAATAEITNKDREALIKNEIVQFQAYTNNIKAFFQEADKDGSGMLSWDEFQEHLKVPKVAAYFRSLELDMTQAQVMFKLLDRDGNGEVSLDEFLAGCLRLKGQAKSLEVNMLLYENKRLFTKISDFMEVMAGQSPLAATAASTKRSRRPSTLFSVRSD